MYLFCTPHETLFFYQTRYPDFLRVFFTEKDSSPAKIKKRRETNLIAFLLIFIQVNQVLIDCTQKRTNGIFHLNAFNHQSRDFNVVSVFQI